MDHPLRLRFVSSPAGAGPVAGPAALTLRSGATLSLRLQAGDRVMVDSGRVWLTQEGDHVAAGGQHLAHRAATVVLECDSTVWARIRVGRA
jgi:hypothetical protein